jgi:hypothetical protein
MVENFNITIYNSEFVERLISFRKEWYNHYRSIGSEKTPEYDGTGKKIVDTRPDGYDYIEESYMREALDKHFPGWSWEAAAPLQFLGAEWVVAQGHLSIIDEHLLAFDILPPVRKFYGVDSVRIQFKRGVPHTPENIVDVGDNCKQATTAALKYAINRLTHIGDDIYGKRLEMAGAGSAEEIITMENANPDTQAQMFNNYIKEHRIPYSKVFTTLGIKSLSEITDYAKAYKTLRGE